MTVHNSRPDPLEALVLEIQASAKYRHVSEDLIRRLGSQELATRRNLKEAVKETKNTLHQVAGAFLDRKMRYDAWLQALAQAKNSPSIHFPPADSSLIDASLAAASSTTSSLSDSFSFIAADSIAADPDVADHAFSNISFSQSFRQTCVDIMENHASTRERLPFLEVFYAQTLARVQPVRSVLDVCSGLNPLSLPWMPLAPDAACYACDLYGDMMAFLNGFFALTPYNGRADVCDVVGSPPTQKVHVALLLKALPPLEQTGKAGTLPLLQALQAEHILVSFPTRTLGGRNKQMGAHYETRFRDLIAAEKWELERFSFDNELCFLISK